MDVKPKKVLYISYDGMTDQLGQSQVIPYLKELAKSNYRFTLLSVEKKDRLEKNGPTVAAILKEAGIEWVTLPFTSRPPVISKIIDQGRLNRTAKKLHRRNRYDVIHCRSYVPVAAGLAVAKHDRVPLLFDMRGFWVDERVDSGLWKMSNPVYRSLYHLFKKKERRYFRESSHIISLTYKGKDELIARYDVPGEKISVIPCCADLDHFNFETVSESAVEELRKKLEIPADVPVLSYLGSLGGWYMTDEMLDFFATMRKRFPAAIFLFITHDSRESVVQKAAGRGIPAEAIRVEPAARAVVPVFLALSHWNIFFIRDLYSKKASSPTKQGEVMGMGIPIICNDIGDTGAIVRETNTGLVIDTFDSASYDNACDQLDRLRQISRQSIRQAAFRNYDLQTGVATYKNVYEKLLQTTNPS